MASRNKSVIQKEIRSLEAKLNDCIIELYKLEIEKKIKKSKAGEKIFCVLAWDLPPEIYEALKKIYTEKGWNVSFPIDSRGDGGCIELSRLVR